MAGINWIGILQPQDASKPAQPGGCAQCHPGLGAKPNLLDKLTDADYNNIDCLICHAPNYKRVVIKDGDTFKFAPAPGVDVLAAAQGVQKPTSEMCLRCHTGAGGGVNAKHGVVPTVASDAHLAAGIDCVACHITKNHKVAGGADLKAYDLPDVQVTCEQCHTAQPHKGTQAAILDQHIAKIACQTCHIPAAARDPKMPTLVVRDWTKPVLNATTGLYGPTDQWQNNVKPECRWWNRWMQVPPAPVGSLSDGQSKIYPWKRVTYINIADAATGDPIYIKAGVYQTTGDVAAAAKKGADDAKQTYSGQWKGITGDNFFVLDHQVAPKDQALACNACHSSTSILDYRALGYSDDRIKALTTSR